eukprot:scaffold57679_cov22-Tisochrysis_lutea.AAC.1
MACDYCDWDPIRSRDGCRRLHSGERSSICALMLKCAPVRARAFLQRHSYSVSCTQSFPSGFQVCISAAQMVYRLHAQKLAYAAPASFNALAWVRFAPAIFESVKA